MKYATQTEYWVDPLTGEHRDDFDDLYSDFEDAWECSRKVESLITVYF